MSYLSELDCNIVTSVFKNAFTGNIIPHEWYKKITTTSGRPDTSLISILAEIVYWYRPGKDGSSKFNGDAWQTSYDHFEGKFGYSREGLRKKFVKLEQLRLVTREFRTIEYRGYRYNNVLFLHLNTKELAKITNLDDKKISSNVVKLATPSPTKVGDHIEEEIKKENKEKYRSNESNFVLEILKSNSSQTELKADLHSITEIIKPGIKSFSGKNLFEYHPLSESDTNVLSAKSGREFNLNFINQLLLKLASKYPNHQFPNKEAFINYMAKALENEMHQACMVNNSGFKMRIYNQKSAEFLDQSNIEKYLTEIENTKTTTTEAIFKRKLTGVLEPEKAYKLLKAFKNWSREGRTIKLLLRNLIELSDFDKQIILEQAKTLFDTNDDNKIENIEFIIDSQTGLSTYTDTGVVYLNEGQSLPNNVWGKVREGLIERYGSDIDKSWFSILKADIDEKARKIYLVSSSEFIKGWIQTNYFHSIEQISKKLGFEILGLRC